MATKEILCVGCHKTFPESLLLMGAICKDCFSWSARLWPVYLPKEDQKCVPPKKK